MGVVVLEVLCSNNPEACPELSTSLYNYIVLLLESFPFNIMEDTMIEVGCQIHGEYGPGGTDTVSIQHWISCYGEASAELLQIFASLTECLAN